MASINLGRVGFVLRGTWSATESYQPLDVVYYSGASYAARIANSGIAPNNSSAWQEMTADMAASVAQAAWSATQAAGSARSAAGSAAAAAGSANDAANSAKASAQSAREAEAVAHLTIDRTPRAGSANPVSSGGVYNALATKQGTLTFDNAPTAGSDNPVKSGGIKAALDGKKNTQTAVSSPSANGNALSFIDTISQNEQGVIAATKKAVTVDTTPTANSTNPVQSGGVKAALDGKQNALTFDNVPTINSDNPVKSGGIKAALDGKKNTQTAVSSPSASGNALSFIDTISQNEQGVIAATKKAVTVDTTPTANSTNPVQSGGVKAALDGKQNALTFDSAPTANSNNPVKSSGVKAALDEKLNTIGKGINLLDNWYFIGGGSQQGGGQFPINQRGQTSYTSGTGYGIDRWKRYVHGGNLLNIVLEGKYLTLNSNMLQFLPNVYRKCLNGKKVTASVLTYEGELISNVFNYDDSLNPFEPSIPSEKIMVRLYRFSGEGEGRLCFLIGNKGEERHIVASKLELGDTQTLAHQENGKWVLNDPPPDYDMELLKCQLSTADSSDTYANRKLIPITVNMGTVTGTGSTVTITKSVTGITSNMTVDRIEFGTPSAVQSGWTVTTTTNSVTFSAVINGSTTVKIKVSDSLNVTGT